MEDNKEYTINIMINSGEVPECYSFHDIPTKVIKEALKLLDAVRNARHTED